VSVFTRDLVYVLYVEEQAQLMHLLGIDGHMRARLQADGIQQGGIRQRALALFHRVIGRSGNGRNAPDNASVDDRELIQAAERVLEANSASMQQVREWALNMPSEEEEEEDEEGGEGASPVYSPEEAGEGEGSEEDEGPLPAPSPVPASPPAPPPEEE